jgi:DNA modification methylase
MITKPRIFGWGMNWQHCSNVAFMGLSDSYESYYQAVRRCWRFGQKSPVRVHVVVSDAEADVLRNVRAKQEVAEAMADDVIRHMGDLETASLHGIEKVDEPYVVAETVKDSWSMLLGDSCERMREVESGSVGLSVFSPPFASLYTYSPSSRDLGNSSSYDGFFRHFGFIIEELLRVSMPCRRSCVHVQQVTTTKATHGIIGWRDFRADTVRAFQDRGWIYDGEIVIDKDPQAQAIRTKSKALMFVQKNKDSAWSRPAMADYVLLFRAPGENAEPIVPDVSNEEWISWARPIWYGIRETETLNVVEARENKDERHICPLQLETIRRCVRLWSNPGDLVLSPFAGIGSEGYEAVRLGRRFLGIELKKSYYDCAVRNLGVADREQVPLFASDASS